MFVVTVNEHVNAVAHPGDAHDDKQLEEQNDLLPTAVDDDRTLLASNRSAI
jgi:hypothetical protein